LLRLACQNLKKEKKKRRRRRGSSQKENAGITTEDVWQHLGYPEELINGSRVTDKTRTICEHCMKMMPYTAANIKKCFI